MSTNIFNKWQNPDGSENYKCRAWVRFTGTGTPAVVAGGNISSITDNGVGNYTVNLLAAMPDVGYAVVPQNATATFASGANNAQLVIWRTDLSSTTAVRLLSYYTDASGIGIAFDAPELCAAIFR